MTSTPCCEKCHNLHQNGETTVIGCGNPACQCHQTVEKNYRLTPLGKEIKEAYEGVVKNDAPEWKERFLKQFPNLGCDERDFEGDIEKEGVIAFIEAQKALSYEEGKDVGVSEVIYHKDSYQKGYEEGIGFAKPYFKAGIAKAMEEIQKIKDIAPFRWQKTLSDLLTTLEKLQ